MFPRGRLVLAGRYAELLGGDGVVRGLIGPREVPRLWERHLLNCAVLAEAVPNGARVCDIGSGAGLPGLVLAIARPDLVVTLVEPLLRRTTFLQEVVDALGLDRVTVVRGRAEEMRGAASYDVVTSRAVAPLERLLGWSMPLVTASGSLLAMKGASAADEIAASRATWVRMGCAEPEVITVGAVSGVSTATVVRVVWADPARVSSTSASRDRPSGRRARPRADDRRKRP